MTRLALLLGVCAAAAPAAPVTLAPATHAAVVAAVRARMGADADVQVVAALTLKGRVHATEVQYLLDIARNDNLHG